MSTSMGFRYLFEAGHIDREMDTWFHVSIWISVLLHSLTVGETGTESGVCG